MGLDWANPCHVGGANSGPSIVAYHLPTDAGAHILLVIKQWSGGQLAGSCLLCGR